MNDDDAAEKMLSLASRDTPAMRAAILTLISGRRMDECRAAEQKARGDIKCACELLMRDQCCRRPMGPKESLAAILGCTQTYENTVCDTPSGGKHWISYVYVDKKRYCSRGEHETEIAAEESAASVALDGLRRIAPLVADMI